MHPKKTSAASIEDKIIHYANLPPHELQSIQPVWAYGRSADLLLDKSLHPENKAYTVHLVKTTALIAIGAFGEVDMSQLFTGDVLNDGRIARLLMRWNQKQAIDPPGIYLTEKPDGKIYFSDDRHRTKLTYFLGHAKMPVAIPVADFKGVKLLIELY